MRPVISSLALVLVMVFLPPAQLWATAPNYEAARSLGGFAADTAADMLGVSWDEARPIVLTNAGYARPGGLSTLGCLDGLARGTGASQGSSTLLSLQARFDQPLWFAFYNTRSGRCAYLQVDPGKARDAVSPETQRSGIFAVQQTARIEAGHVLSQAKEFIARAGQGLFGQNLFRVVTAANAAAQDCPDDLLTAIRLHDHYCPGVTSGVLMVRFIQEEILSGDPSSPCFVLSLDPWCKEDALTTLLNATPGKRSYGVIYPEEGRVSAWPKPLDKTSTVVFKRTSSGGWQARLLRFDFAKAKEMFTGPGSGNPIVDKLAMDLWFMDYLDRPGAFVSEVARLELPEGMHPKALLRPGANPVEMLAGML